MAIFFAIFFHQRFLKLD